MIIDDQQLVPGIFQCSLIIGTEAVPIGNRVRGIHPRSQGNGKGHILGASWLGANPLDSESLAPQPPLDGFRQLVIGGENDTSAGVLPALGQRETAHDVPGADLRAAVSAHQKRTFHQASFNAFCWTCEFNSLSAGSASTNRSTSRQEKSPRSPKRWYTARMNSRSSSASSVQRCAL